MDSLLPFEKIERKILIKKEANSTGQYGSDPDKRTIKDLINCGMINLNKVQGPTSHQVSDYIKQSLELNKAGHSGTLDPNVSGVLPIATGNATKIVQVLLTAGKEYITIIHIHELVEDAKIREAVQEFIGTIKQLPPVRSAVKREIREREVYYMELMEIDGQDILAKIGCQAGTYIRKIAHDLGQMLGPGAHMAELIRTKAGPFSYKTWVTMHDVKDAYETWKETGDETQLRKVILPVEEGARHLPKIWVSDNAVDTLSHGASLSAPGIVKLHDMMNQGDTVAIMTLKEELLAIGTAQMNSQNMMFQKKGIAANQLRVFMQPGIYPKFIKRPEQTL